MLGVKQGYNECALATLANLAGRPLDDVRRAARELTGLPWHTFLDRHLPTGGTNPVHYRILEELARRFYLNLGHDGLEGACSVNRFGRPLQLRRIPIRGRGYITVRVDYGFYVAGHIMAWENGRIYDSDPDAAVCETWAQWRKRNSGWVPVKLWREPALQISSLWTENVNNSCQAASTNLPSTRE